MNTLILASAGHVDHGKTALVKNLTGTDTDTLAEEKARGLTINPGYAYHHFPGGKVLGIVDLPGHRDFINNMLAGSAAVDGALLVVAADDGIMPQTREHTAILDLLGLGRGLAVITKIDRVDEARVKAVSADLKSMLAGTGLAGIPIFTVSNTDNDNSTGGTGNSGNTGIDKVRDCLGEMFRDESADAAENDRVPSLTPNNRYLIDRVFTIKGAGTVVTGCVLSGCIKSDTRLVHSASGQTARLRGLRLDQDEVQQAIAGNRVALNINLPPDLLQRGDCLTDEILCHPVTRLNVRLRLLEENNKGHHQKPKLRPTTEYHLHLCAAHRLVHVSPLGDGPYYQLSLDSPLCACYGDRFILRDASSRHTIGGGMVIDWGEVDRNRSSMTHLKVLQSLDNPHETGLVKLLELLPAGVDLQRFAAVRNLQMEHLIEAIQKQAPFSQHRLLRMEHGGYLLHKRYFEAYQQQILASLHTVHREQPEQTGLSETLLAQDLNAAISDLKRSRLPLAALLDSLVDSGHIAKSGTIYHLPGHKPRLSPEEKQFMATLRPLLLEAGHTAPRTNELVTLTGIPLKSLQGILRQSVRSGNLVQVADNRHYLPETILELAAFTADLAAQAADGGFSVIVFRDASGLGRNLCIDILEYFDRIGYTHRAGNSRFLRAAIDEVFGSSTGSEAASRSATTAKN